MVKPPKRNVMVGKWLPGDREIIGRWAKNQLEMFKKKYKKQYEHLMLYFPDVHTFEEEVQQIVKNAQFIDEIAKLVLFKPCICNLIRSILTNPGICMLMVDMFQPKEGNPMKLIHFIFTLNAQLSEAPVYEEDTGDTIPCPIGSLLTYAMSTPAGFAGFLKDEINTLFKGILNAYGAYLSNPKQNSKDVLTKDGWLGGDNFTKTFICPDVNDPHYGFKTWDEYFTRKFYDSERPVADKDNQYVITNACENAPFRISYTVSRNDAFWIKTQPYSLQYILGEDEDIERFVGGTIYQGFLSPHTYHRFHAPVSGKIVTAKPIAGTYFSQPYYLDSKANYIASQPYLAHMATRAVYIIDTKDLNIGQVAFVAIGMVDVSTVKIDSKLEPGVDVVKGDDIGTFHFGGSSHLLIFEKGVQLAFDLQGIEPDPNGDKFLNVRSKIATVVPTTAPNKRRKIQ